MIVGGGWSQNIKSKEIPDCHSFPSDSTVWEEEPFTTFKKRTYLQGQLSKAKATMRHAHDYLISTEKIQKGKVINIDNKEVNKSFPLIPNESHPYDHYIVSGEIEFERTREFNLQKAR